MKDEEIAEEYLDEKCKDCYMCSYSEHKNPYKICQRRKDRKQAFLAGLKAGRPQWHDLRENPYDLPYMETELLCQKSSGRCFVGYYSDDNKFHSHETGKSYEIVRWIDIGIWWSIPTFDKE